MEMRGAIEILEERIKTFQTAIRVLRELDAEQTVPAPVIVKPRGPYRKKAQKEKPPGAGAKTCKKCGEVKLVDDFPKHKDCKDGHTGRCKACGSAKARIRYHTETAHTGPLPFACDECHAKFSSRAALDGHVGDRHP